MLKKPSYGVRRNALVAVTALVVAYVRTVLQYHRYSWQSIGEFLTSWLIHYFAILVLVAIAYAFIKTDAKFFFEGGGRKGRGMTPEEALFFVSVILLVEAVLIFFLAHAHMLLPLDDIDIYE